MCTMTTVGPSSDRTRREVPGGGRRALVSATPARHAHAHTHTRPTTHVRSETGTHRAVSWVWHTARRAQVTVEGCAGSARPPCACRPPTPPHPTAPDITPSQRASPSPSHHTRPRDGHTTLQHATPQRASPGRMCNSVMLSDSGEPSSAEVFTLSRCARARKALRGRGIDGHSARYPQRPADDGRGGSKRGRGRGDEGAVRGSRQSRAGAGRMCGAARASGTQDPWPAHMQPSPRAAQRRPTGRWAPRR
jgi:hypothetical protein